MSRIAYPQKPSWRERLERFMWYCFIVLGFYFITGSMFPVAISFLAAVSVFVLVVTMNH